MKLGMFIIEKNIMQVKKITQQKLLKSGTSRKTIDLASYLDLLSMC